MGALSWLAELFGHLAYKREEAKLSPPPAPPPKKGVMGCCYPDGTYRERRP